MIASYASIVVNGMSIGIAFFLAAVGLTILFGILRILNFAHGSFIMVGAYLASVGLHYVGKYGAVEFLLIAVAVGAVIGALGLIVDRIIFRRLHGLDEAVALIATFALMLIVNGGAELIWGANFKSIDPPEGLAGAVNLGPLVVPSFSLFLLVVGVIVFLLVDVFVHRSWAGKTLQAIAEDRWIMGILGHSPRRLELLAVFLAFFLAGFAGTMLAPNQVLSPGVGNHFIIQAFAVVIVGGLGSIRGTFLAAMLLGLAESIGSVVMPSLSLYIAMIVILLLRPQGLIAPRGSSAPGSWSFSWLWQGLSARRRAALAPRVAERAPLRGDPAIRSSFEFPGVSRSQLGLLLALAIALPLLPTWTGAGVIFIASLVLIAAVFALSWNLMFGFGGIATFGHAAFFAIGGYIAAYLLKSMPQMPFVVVLVAAIALGALVAGIIGIVAIRRATGIQLAILTLALAEVFRVLISNSEALGRDEGLSAIPRPRILGSLSGPLASDTSYYLFLCVACGLMVWVLWLLCHSAFGRTLRSIHQDAQRASFLGIGVDRVRLFAFIIAAAIAAYAGALLAPLTQIVTPEAASIARSTQPMLHTLVGGAGSFWGPAVGALIFASIDYATRTLPGLSEIIMGATLLLIVLLAPMGVTGYVKRLGGTLLRKRMASGAGMLGRHAP